jgi:hypothetical protein
LLEIRDIADEFAERGQTMCRSRPGPLRQPGGRAPII